MGTSILMAAMGAQDAMAHFDMLIDLLGFLLMAIYQREWLSTILVIMKLLCAVNVKVGKLALTELV
jgi:hypothetical protein